MVCSCVLLKGTERGFGVEVPWRVYRTCGIIQRQSDVDAMRWKRVGACRTMHDDRAMLPPKHVTFVTDVSCNKFFWE